MAGCSEDTNESLQVDEVQALSAIFEDEWIVEDSYHKVYSIKIKDSQNNIVHFEVSLPDTYPLDSPPIYQLSAPWMSRIAKQNLGSALEDVYCQNIGQSIIYLWIETIKDFINKNPAHNENLSQFEEELFVPESLSNHEKESITFDELPLIEHGEPIVDRKSAFQAHIARVVSVEQVNQVLQKLKENKKIAVATHNIVAYRISRGNDARTCIQDCDDDGETKAGSGLLHLLQIVDATDVLVVVSRWYGGVHLGPDRFKHINNAARSLLFKLGLISEKSQTTTKKNQKR